ncbi:methionyl-tRNA formyltransferase [Salisaeta longa]|uniref:methionyl-tRNA formyltransferase n=1 Tax=Salisaeta longa TaxID=503170 RepID=UPI0003B7A47B|nr:methionyl-tRNA formyltransferase [Salisaeta longa]
MRIVFMGTPEFAVPSLRALIAHDYPPVAVVTGPDRPRGRGQRVTPTPVKAVAQEAGIAPILQPDSVRDASFADAVAALSPDVIVVVAFKILPPAVYETAAQGAFNLHGSLLPKYRGAAPINWAVMNGETETGVTTFFLQKQVDTGQIILRKSMPIGPNETAGDVHDRMMHLGAEAVVETVQHIEAGTVDPQPQDDSKATPAPKIFPDDCAIPWGRTASDVHNHIRGLSPYPGAWTMHGDTRLKVYRARVASGQGEPGTVLSAGEQLVVACDTGAVALTELQQPGKQRHKATDFLNGYDIAAGDVLTT